MKNAMKRIMSLLLVTMLLISAAPFALAANADYVVKFDESQCTHQISGAIAEPFTAAAILADAGVSNTLVNMNWGNKKNTSDPTQEVAAAERTISVRVEGVCATCAAASAPVVVDPIHVVVKANESDNPIHEFDKVPSNGEYATVENLLSYGWNSDWTNTYSFDHAWNSTQKKNAGKSDKVNAGDLLYIMLNNTKSEAEIEEEEETNTSHGTISGRTYTFNYAKANKYKYDVNLHIFLNGNTSSEHKLVTINSYATDDVISLEEVKGVIRSRYTAKDSDGIGYDGLYLGTGPWLSNYANDEYFEYIKGVLNARGNQTVDLYIVINNAKVSSSNADTSNPKTGDNITIAFTTMALAAAGLVSVMELKKRKMI